MGRGQGGSTSYGKRTPGGIKTSSQMKMSAIGEIEAKHGVLGDDTQVTSNNTTSHAGIGTAANLAAKKIDRQRGSNDGGTFESTDGKKNYVKFYDDAGQAYGEAIATNIYNALGLKAPKSTLFDPDSPNQAQAGRGVANEYVEGKTLAKHGLTPEIANKILDGAAADILLANWDTIGLEDDNILVSPTGEPIRIDNGGSLLYRAMGGEKPKSLLNKISEWDVFANDDPDQGPSNPSYAGVIQAAGHSSLDDIMPRMREQVEKINKVAENTNNFEDLVIEAPGVDPQARAKILEMLQARRDLLNKKVGINQGIGTSSAMKNQDTQLTEQDKQVERIAKTGTFALDQKAFTEPTFPGSAGLVFASPNREDEGPKDEMRHLIKRSELRLASEEQKAFNQASHDIDAMLGLNRKTANAIGVWTDGAENSTATKYDNGNLELVRASAAMKGLLGEQKAVAVFTPDPNATSTVYEFNAKTTPAVANHVLSLAGFQFHTFVPLDDSGTNFKIAILDDEPNTAKRKQLERMAYRFNRQQETPIKEVKGRLEFMGSNSSRAEGAETYNQVIKEFLTNHPEYEQEWLALNKEWQFGANKDQDETKYQNYKAQSQVRDTQQFVMDTVYRHLRETSDNPTADIAKARDKYLKGELFDGDKIPKLSELIKKIKG